ncbi:MAG: class IV adenylate cyclase [Methanolinea sp.]|jgi:adenylate cyclase class 2|nr:class IV adenylate cyclase [Methanolinea sp.]
MLEIELKARVGDLPAVRERLLLLHAEPEGRVMERDLYLNAPHRDFGKTDEALRIRHAGGRCTVTYKGQKKRDFHLKAREELNCGVESGDVMTRIFLSLGFVEVAEVRKWREYFRFRDATVCLDEVEGLGEFVEIELNHPEAVEKPAAYVAALGKEIGVTGEPILSSYLELLLSAGNLVQK